MRGLLLGLALVLLANVAGAVEWTSVRTRSGLHGTHGRLVFDWPGKVGYDVKVEGGRLIIAFDKPISSSFGAAERQLAKYIGGATLSNGGRTVSFPLRRPITPKTFVVNRSVVVDLYPASAGARAARKTPAPLVKVRAGEHSTYTRFVFDWPGPVGYDLASDSGETVISFDAPARLETDGLAKQFEALLDAGASGTSDGVSTVRLDVPADREIRHFRLGNRVVVDLVRKPAHRDELVARATETPSPPQPDKPEPKAEALRERVEPPASGSTAEEPDATNSVESKSAEAELPAIMNAARDPSGRTMGEESAPEPLPVAVEPVIHRPTGTEHALQVAASSDSADTVLVPLVTAPRAEATTSGGDDQPGVSEDDPVVDVGFIREGDFFSLTFPGLGPTRASVFSRADGAWMVFDRLVELRLDTLAELAPALARDATVLEHPLATVLRIEGAAGYGMSARRFGADWIVDFDRSRSAPHRALAVSVEPDAVPGPRLVIAVERPGRPVELIDPEVGDRLIAVPIASPQTGFAEARKFPEVELLATAQGIAVVQRADGLLVSRNDAGVEIATSTGLLLSRTPMAPTGRPAVVPPPSHVAAGDIHPARLFDFGRWQRGEQSFIEARQELEHALMGADEEATGAARLELARFYFARGLAAEALGVLETIEAEPADLAGRSAHRALRGAANLLAHRLERAEADLFHPDLDGLQEAALWRGALHAMRGEWAEAGPLFEKGWPVVATYPKWLRQEFGLRAAEAAINRGDDVRGESYLTVVADDVTRDPVRSRVRFLEGRILAQQGDTADAIALWNTLAGGTDQFAHAKAEFASVKLGLREGIIERAEAIERLERLRFAWRGDALEFETLQLLGRCYLETGDYWNGLGTLREAVSLFSGSLDTAGATELMVDGFRKLFVDGEARDIPPLKAVSLYQEFRELTPVGEEGDRVVRNLAARLVSLDLLAPAAELLENQVRHRLDGERRARTSADLALIHILNREPAKAVDVLRMSDMAALPEDLLVRRRHLLARGLSELGQTEEALRVLASDRSREADALRADIYWKAANWSKAAGIYGRMAETVPANGLSDADSRIVLKWGVALLLSHDRDRLGRVARDFGKAMAETPYDAAFRMITASQPTSGGSLATIADTLADVEDFQSYLKGYRSAFERSATVATSTGGSPS